jgi:hypothetical protein
MKNLLLAFTALALLSSAAMANGKTSTVTVHSENSHADRALACNPAIGNWINASPVTCPMQGSGPSDTTQTYTVKETYTHEKKI